ncbi:MAG TPA: hypothetical protein VF606_02445, partial [Geminicoccaceae bacterium]
MWGNLPDRYRQQLPALARRLPHPASGRPDPTGRVLAPTIAASGIEGPPARPDKVANDLAGRVNAVA